MLYIAGYSDIGSTTRGSIAIPLEPPMSKQALEVGPSSVQSDPFPKDVCLVKLLSDEDCLIDIGDDPDATNSQRKLMAGKEQTLSITAGMGLKVAVAASNPGSVTGMDSLESLLKLIASPADAQTQFAAMQANVDKLTAAAKVFQDASAENRAISDQLVQSTKEALTTKEAAINAASDVAQREAQLDKDIRDHADKVAADAAAFDARTKAMDDREAALNASFADIQQREVAANDLAANLATQQKDIDARQAIFDAAQADFNDRAAKIKALAG